MKLELPSEILKYAVFYTKIGSKIFVRPEQILELEETTDARGDKETVLIMKSGQEHIVARSSSYIFEHLDKALNVLVNEQMKIAEERASSMFLDSRFVDTMKGKVQ